jgi:glycosyltransferase involved in cell wall biosynthesis
MPKVILISQAPLPYHRIGSWTTLYQNYFKSEHSQIDIIICEKPEYLFEGVTYGIVANNLRTKLNRRFFKKPYQAYIDCLFSQIKPDEKYIIQIVDNFGFAKALYQYLINYPQYKAQLYIQFFYHGYAPFYGNFESRWFFEFIDEMVLLTHSSYLEHKKAYTILPCLFSVLHNGIDTSKFYAISPADKKAFKLKHNVSDKTVFMWCSLDRPKKGLDFILKVWKTLMLKHQNIELWIIGSKRDIDLEHVKCFGKIQNHLIAEYYQTADCYLFPTLWHEGFGLSLIEALHCGNYCIASALGGVPEVLQDGKLGVLIEHPHYIEEWIRAIEDFLKQQKTPNQLLNIYTKEHWVTNMNTIINQAKRLNN